MNHANPTAKLESVEQFDIPVTTRISVRWKDTVSKLTQECVVTRHKGRTVQAKLIEFNGSEYKIKVDLVQKTAELIFPDLSYFPEPQGFPYRVAEQVGKMLTAKHSQSITAFRKEIALA